MPDDVKHMSPEKVLKLLTSERSEEVPFFDEVFGPVAYRVTRIRGFSAEKLFKILELEDGALEK